MADQNKEKEAESETRELAGPSNESSKVSRSAFDLFASETSATLQVQRSQTAGVEKTKSVGLDGLSLERSTDNENAIGRVGSPFEGPNDVFEQVR